MAFATAALSVAAERPRDAIPRPLRAPAGRYQCLCSNILGVRAGTIIESNHRGRKQWIEGTVIVQCEDCGKRWRLC